MREILFRGQTRRFGEKIKNFKGEPMPSNWVYGGVCKGKGDFSIIYGSMDVELEAPTEKHVVYTDTLGQFTGLTDKNGKKIFEGDIVKYKTVCRFSDCDEDLEQFANENPEETYDCIDVVKWYEKGCCFSPMPNRDDCEDYWYSTGSCSFEVIGNIHDNPELLGGGEE